MTHVDFEPELVIRSVAPLIGAPIFCAMGLARW